MTYTALAEPCLHGEHRDLRWVLLHPINETARHAGHADATREMLDRGLEWTSAADALIAIVTNRVHSDVSRRGYRAALRQFLAWHNSQGGGPLSRPRRSEWEQVVTTPSRRCCGPSGTATGVARARVPALRRHGRQGWHGHLLCAALTHAGRAPATDN